MGEGEMRGGGRWNEKERREEGEVNIRENGEGEKQCSTAQCVTVQYITV